MITGARTATTRSRLYRGGWLIVVLAFASYLLVAVAEQGSVGAGLSEVPNEPLPFSLHQGVGVDLSTMSSLDALEWLNQADPATAPMLVLPIDGDIVAAFNDPETFSSAHTAVQTLIEASADAPVAICLKKPVSAVDESVLAEAVVTVIVEDFTDSVAYVATCPGETSTTWQGTVLDLLGIEDVPAEGERLLAPVSIGSPIRLPAPIESSELSETYVDGLAGASYVAITLGDEPPLSPALRDDIQRILNDRAHIALTLARPSTDAPPTEFMASIAFTAPPEVELAEGYNAMDSSTIAKQGEWAPTQIGQVLYLRSTTAGSTLTAEFIGTEVWAVGLVSPQAGSVGVWIDYEGDVTQADPDTVVDLSQLQARDRAIPLIDHLPAARHLITIATTDGDVTLAGLFVTGRPEAGWHGGLGALGIMTLGVAGLAVVISVAVDDLRIRIGLDRSDEEADHPRVFRRDL